MERMPIATTSGWTWHKNHQLPRLNISCGAAPPDGSACLISAVTVDVLTHAAHDAGLDGGTLQPLVNGACSFSSLTFKTTSYNLKGKPIHLMASLLIREGERLCIATSLLSPPLLVDARKRQSKEEKGNKALEAAASSMPFAPALLERRLEKVDRESARRVIDNSLDGLRAYLSALNIRNKCKHPLFLVLRFSACLGLWYDTTIGTDPLADDTAFRAMMRELSSHDGKGTLSISSATGEPARLMPYLIAIKSYHESGECHHFGCAVQLPSSLSLPLASTLPTTYTEFSDQQLTTLRRTYCRLFCSHGGSSPPFLLGPPAAGPSRAIVCRESPVPTATPEAQKLGRQAAALLATTRQIVVQGNADEDDDGTECPQREWETVMKLLAESLALHTSSRTGAEIIAFMQHDLQHDDERAAKRSTQDLSFASSFT